jgi:hypothetical protein
MKDYSAVLEVLDAYKRRSNFNGRFAKIRRVKRDLQIIHHWCIRRLRRITRKCTKDRYKLLKSSYSFYNYTKIFLWAAMLLISILICLNNNNSSFLYAPVKPFLSILSGARASISLDCPLLLGCFAVTF